MKIRILILVIAALVVSTASFLITRRVKAQALHSCPAYTLWRQAAQYDSQGNLVSFSVDKITQREDCAVATSLPTKAPDGERFATRIVWLPVEHKSVIVNGMTKSLQTANVSERAVLNRLARNVVCQGLEAKDQLGYRTLKVDLTDSSHEWALWRAPDLSCTAMSSELRPFYIQEGQKVYGPRQVFYPLSVVRTADLNDFVIPSDFVERRPSEIAQEFEKKHHTPAFSRPELVVSADQAYDLGRQTK